MGASSSKSVHLPFALWEEERGFKADRWKQLSWQPAVPLTASMWSYNKLSFSRTFPPRRSEQRLIMFPPDRHGLSLRWRH